MRREKITKEEMLKRLRIIVAEVENEYTREQILNTRRNDSLSYMMSICGHCSEKVWDYDDLFYVAGQIVEIKNHVFHDHKGYKLRAYKRMRELNIPMDFLMKIDYLRTFCMEKIIGHRV